MRYVFGAFCAIIGAMCFAGFRAVADPPAAGSSASEQPKWAMNATIIEACSCPMFCQCYFNEEPAAPGGREARRWKGGRDFFEATGGIAKQSVPANCDQEPQVLGRSAQRRLRADAQCRRSTASGAAGARGV